MSAVQNAPPLYFDAADSNSGLRFHWIRAPELNNPTLLPVYPEATTIKIDCFCMNVANMGEHITPLRTGPLAGLQKLVTYCYYDKFCQQQQQFAQGTENNIEL